eukprot:2249951-Rhodomonas_salina.4
MFHRLIGDLHTSGASDQVCSYAMSGTDLDLRYERPCAVQSSVPRIVLRICYAPPPTKYHVARCMYVSVLRTRCLRPTCYGAMHALCGVRYSRRLCSYQNNKFQLQLKEVAAKVCARQCPVLA